MYHVEGEASRILKSLLKPIPLSVVQLPPTLSPVTSGRATVTVVLTHLPSPPGRKLTERVDTKGGTFSTRTERNEACRWVVT